MAKSKEMEIAIKIAGKVGSSFKSALGTVTKGLGSIVSAVSTATTAAAAAVSAMGVAAVNVGREFEASMSQVAATMLIDKNAEAGKKNFEILENAARECGRSTAFSATEAAEALNYLALAGYDAEKAATALPTVLKLAGAGAMDLGAASDMVTDSMSALGIAATEANLTNFANQLAQTASKANTSVSQLGEAIITVGGTAKDLAGGTTELNAVLGILADNGIKASEGGTHLRNMILALQDARSGDAAAMFKEMGISAYTAEGEMRSLGDVFGDLNASLEGASSEKVNKTLATIFNQTDLASARAMLAATVGDVQGLTSVMNAALEESGSSVSALGLDIQALVANFDQAITGEEFAAQMLDQFGMTGEQAGVLFNGLQSIVNGTGNRFKELTQEIENCYRACEDMYAIQLDNLNGDIDILKSGLSDLGISIYQDLSGPLRSMTQLATSMVGELSAAYQDGGMEALVGAVGGCLSQVVNVIADNAPRVVGMGIKLLEKFIGGITGNSGLLADAAADVLFAFVNGLFTLVPQVIFAGIDIIARFAQSVSGQLPQLMSTGTQAIANFVTGIIQRLPVIISTALTLVQTFVGSIGSNAPMLISAAVQLVGNLVLGIIQMLPRLLQMGVQLVGNLVQGILSNLPLILQMAVQIVTNFVSGIVSMIPMIIQGGIQLIISLIQGIMANLGNIAQASGEITGALAGGLIQSIPQIFTAGAQLLGALIEMIFTTDWLQVGIDIIKGIIKGLVSAGKSVWEAIKSLFTGKETEIDMPDSGAVVAQNYAAGIESNAYVVGNAMDSLQMMTFSNMDYTMATTAGAGMVSAFNDGLMGSSVTTKAATTAAALGTGLVDNLDGSWKTVNSSAQTAMQDLSTTVTTEAQSAANAVKSAFEDMTITIPKPRIPRIEVSTNSVSYGNGGSVSVPDFSVSWNALGGIFDQPTIFNTPAGMQGVGEKGPEAILPLDTLWAKMKEILNEAIAASSGASLIDTFVGKLNGIGTGGVRNIQEIDGDDGLHVQYSPVYNLYGSTTKQEVIEAERISQAEFDKRMKQYERDRQRRRL